MLITNAHLSLFCRNTRATFPCHLEGKAEKLSLYGERITIRHTLIEMRTDVNAVTHASLSEKPKETGFRSPQLPMLKPPKVKVTNCKAAKRSIDKDDGPCTSAELTSTLQEEVE